TSVVMCDAEKSQKGGAGARGGERRVVLCRRKNTFRGTDQDTPRHNAVAFGRREDVNSAMKAKPKINKPPVLFSETQKIITALDKRLECAVMGYWSAPNGSICQDDVLTFYALLRQMGRQKRVALYVKSDGGTGMASLRIVHLLRQYCDHVTVMVPLNCVSAATMIALGADEIRMGPLAHLSAVDTSLTTDLSPIDHNNSRVSVSLDELTRILNLWRKESKDEVTNPYSAIFNHIHPLVIGAVDRSSSLSIRLCKEILSYHLKDPKKADRI